MPTKVKERPRPMDLKTSDPHCRRCVGIPKKQIPADRVWAWSRRNPGISPFRESSKQ